MSERKQLWQSKSPVIIGITGGSGAGKTWLAHALLERFKKEACLVSLDDFYRDRSHLPAGVRNRINFDHPRSIDWPALTSVMESWSHGKKALLPCYDFTTHSQCADKKTLAPRSIIVMEGLWLFRRPALRKLFAYKIFVDCRPELRLRRRIGRDFRERGRTEASVVQQFHNFVEPMHQRFVAPQKRWADVVFEKPPTARDVERIVEKIKLNRPVRNL